MYKAIHAQTGQEIIILSPQWRGRTEALRALDRADLLVCQGCRQPLRVKAGEVKRPHFAHKHLKACSLGSESPEILNARAVLYGWLLQRYGQSTGAAVTTVTVEKQIADSHLPRLVDCWVETEAGAIAYWIVEAGIKLEPRVAIRAALQQPGIQAQYVFLEAMRQEEKKELHSLLLTPTERAFLQSTAYDQVLAGPAEVGSSLHYLDADREILTTYRGLALFHAPNWYKGFKKTSSLGMVRVSREDGGFIHPGEEERLRAYRLKHRRLEEKREAYRARETGWQSYLAARRLNQEENARKQGRGEPIPAVQGQPPVESTPGSEPQPFVSEALPCVICGQITKDYWNTFTDESGRRLCRCRECLERG